MKRDLFTNVNVVEDAIRFVSPSSNNSKEKPKLFSSNGNNHHANESNDHNEDEMSDDKQGEEKQVEQTGEITPITTTVNQIF